MGPRAGAETEDKDQETESRGANVVVAVRGVILRFWWVHCVLLQWVHQWMARSLVVAPTGIRYGTENSTLLGGFS